MSNGLFRLGRWVAEHRRVVVLVWLAVVIGLVAANRAAGGGTVDNFEVPGVESQQAIDLLDERFPERSGATAMVVFHVPAGGITDDGSAAVITDVVDEIRSLDAVVGVTEPLASPLSVSPDTTTAFAAVQFDAPTAELGRPALDSLLDTADAADGTDV
jgi:RND superfamily putative drug exporter